MNRTGQEIRDDEDAACRLEELRVKCGLPDGTPEEIAAGIAHVLDAAREALAEAWKEIERFRGDFPA